MFRPREGLGFDIRKTRLFGEALESDEVESVKTFLSDSKVDPNCHKFDQVSAFWTMCYLGRASMVKCFLEFEGEAHRAMDYNKPNSDGVTPFAIACRSQQPKVVEMLLKDPRINIITRDINNDSPMDMILRYGRTSYEGLKVMGMIIASEREFYYQTGLDKYDLRGKMLIAYNEDKEKTRRKLRRELGKGFSRPPEEAGELFSLVVYFSDGYLKPKTTNPSGWAAANIRFFNLASRLPMDCQMLLCNITFGHGGSVVSHKNAEYGFRRYGTETFFDFEDESDDGEE